MQVHAVGRADVSPFPMPARFRTDVAYFMTPGDQPGLPPLGPGEYFVRLDDARRWLDDLVVRVVSPLDAAAQAELELTEEQEAWLEWMVKNKIEHIKLS
ncbi:MAG TPA: hypothetical protein PLV92_02620 [Pirellulaceae bacterium]|nr:hypothetical protein [Pirellulaceae bacterium]